MIPDLITPSRCVRADFRCSVDGKSMLCHAEEGCRVGVGRYRAAEHNHGGGRQLGREPVEPSIARSGRAHSARLGR